MKLENKGDFKDFQTNFYILKKYFELQKYCKN